jgi:hemerythrin
MHFRHEEEIMKEAGFPKLSEHQVVHGTMIERIFALQQSHEDKSLHLEMNTMKFVKSWLIDHILQEDYRFRDFLLRPKPSDAPKAQQPTPDAHSAE